MLFLLFTYALLNMSLILKEPKTVSECAGKRLKIRRSMLKFLLQDETYVNSRLIIQIVKITEYT